MSSQAILLSGKSKQPRAVRIFVDDDTLDLNGPNDFFEQIAWWRLFRKDGSGSTHCFGRVDRSDWELRVVAGADHDLLARVKSRSWRRFAGPLHRLQVVKVAGSLIVLAAMLSESVPARWIGPNLPVFAQERLVAGYVGNNARNRCNRPGGEQAVRAILKRLDPALGPTVEIIAFNHRGFMTSALPANKIMVFRDALTAVEANAIAALLAHELSHLRHGDATTAMVREEGNVGTLMAVIEGEDRDRAVMKYSGAEEERADREAMAMMRRAGIPMAQAAAMFEDMRVADYDNKGFGAEQRDFHFGMNDRARQWQKAAAGQPATLPSVIPESQADDLYNFCWIGVVPGKIEIRLLQTPVLPVPAGQR